MAKKTLIVERFERHVQKVTVEVDDSIPVEEQVKQALDIVTNGGGDDHGETEYHSTDDSPENWTVTDTEGSILS